MYFCQKCGQISWWRGDQIPGNQENWREIPEHQYIEFKKNKQIQTIKTDAIQNQRQQQIKDAVQTDKSP